jgi:ElaB/YqjD/DUF883 family membrane-anchored ribosome-binding protein
MAKAAKISSTEKKKYLNNLKKELDTYSKKISNIQKEFKDSTEGNVDQITTSLQDILKEAVVAYGKLESASTEQWDPLKNLAADAFTTLRTSVHDKMNTSCSHMKDLAGKVGGCCHAQMDCVEGYIKDHPLKSLLLALGAGVIIGKLMK